uniref:Uncharacterized protein n=1 Tax=viral metagenome TaxID=1070528 RepID=A0A6M3M4F0_9ZZZZ
MITTIYKCDRCGQEAPNMPMWRLEIRALQLPLETPQGLEVADPRMGCYPQADWCRACMVEVLGLPARAEDPRPAEPRKGKPTVEELAREIAQRLFWEHLPAPAVDEGEEPEVRP